MKYLKSLKHWYINLSDRSKAFNVGVLVGVLAWIPISYLICRLTS